MILKMAKRMQNSIHFRYAQCFCVCFFRLRDDVFLRCCSCASPASVALWCGWFLRALIKSNQRRRCAAAVNHKSLWLSGNFRSLYWHLFSLQVRKPSATVIQMSCYIHSDLIGCVCPNNPLEWSTAPLTQTQTHWN